MYRTVRLIYNKIYTSLQIILLYLNKDIMTRINYYTVKMAINCSVNNDKFTFLVDVSHHSFLTHGIP